MNVTDPRILINFLHVDCIRNFAIHQAILDHHLHIRELNSNFWRVTSNSSRDYGIIQWCKLFGNRNESTHWSHFKYIKNFQTDILKKLLIPMNEWQLTHKSILDFRNNNAAHLNINDWYRTIPELVIARQIVFTSYKVLFKNSITDLDLECEFNRVLEDTNLALSLSHSSQLT